MGAVNPNLMSASGFEAKVQQGIVAQAFESSPVGNRGSSAPFDGDRCHFFTMHGMATDGLVNDAGFGGGNATDNGEVLSAGCVGFNLRLQALMGAIGFGNCNCAAGVFIETVDDTGSLHAADSR